MAWNKISQHFTEAADSTASSLNSALDYILSEINR